MFGGGFPGSFNDDVLNAQPTNAEQASKLVEEIKSRAKACITSRNYPEAVKLYSKAIELTSDDNQNLAILHANRSMVLVNMGKAADALVDADEAVKLDSSYLKGYYRQSTAAMALNDFALAKKALLTGLSLKPDDKEMQAQLAKVEERMSGALAAPSNLPVPRAATRVTVSHDATTQSARNNSDLPSSAPVKSNSTAPSRTNVPPVTPSDMRVDEDDERDLENLNVRGYKKTSDGRTTTFFNREMDEETKNLIGSIAPKKLDASGEVITTGTTTGSAWNAAGTYEEKVFTPWVTESLSQRFRSIQIYLADSNVPAYVKAVLPELVSISVEVTATENVNGHAQITMNRGKKKHVCDFSADLTWQVLVGFSESSARPPAQLQGQISVIDITADREYEVENPVLNKFNDANVSLSSLPTDLQAVYNKVIKSSDGLLQREILVKLNEFWDEFRSK